MRRIGLEEYTKIVTLQNIQKIALIRVEGVVRTLSERFSEVLKGYRYVALRTDEIKND